MHSIAALCMHNVRPYRASGAGEGAGARAPGGPAIMGELRIG